MPSTPLRHPIRRGPGERLAAWVYTGPVGHLYGGLADIVTLWVRWAHASGARRIERR